MQAVMLALVLPALIGLLPQPAFSTAPSLDHDLMLSVCGQDMPQQPDGGQPHAGHEHCLLCANSYASCSPSLAAAAPAFTAPPRRAGLARLAAATAIPPPLQALRDASPPRGPPTLS